MEDNLVEQQALDMPDRTSSLEEIFRNIISSDDESLKRYFDLADKIVDTQVAGADQCYDLAKKSLEVLHQMLDGAKTEEERAKIMGAIDKVLKWVSEEEKEGREHLEKLSSDAYHKDSEKRQFNWTLAFAAGAAMLSVGTIVYLVNRDGGGGHLELPTSGS